MFCLRNSDGFYYVGDDLCWSLTPMDAQYYYVEYQYGNVPDVAKAFLTRLPRFNCHDISVYYFGYEASADRLRSVKLRVKENKALTKLFRKEICKIQNIVYVE